MVTQLEKKLNSLMNKKEVEEIRVILQNTPYDEIIEFIHN